MDMLKLNAMLIEHEGLRLKPYRDTVGKLTIGVGRNLDDVGITKDEAILLLGNDLVKALHDLQTNLDWFYELNEPRQAALINMCFNLGWGGLSKFQRTLAAIEAKKWDDAASEMLDSVWAKQVGNRALKLSEMIRTGQWPIGNK